MKELVFGVLFGLSSVAAFVPAAQADESVCEPPSAALQRAEIGSERAGGTALQISGDRAERFLYFINDKVGRSTDYWGDGVIVARYPALGYDSIAIVDDGCVDETKMIRLDPQTTAMAFAASENPNF